MTAPLPTAEPREVTRDAPAPAPAATSAHTPRALRRIRRRAATGRARVDRVDRAALVLLGLLAAGLGLAVLLAGQGSVALRSPAALHADAVRSAREHEAWWTAGSVGGGALLSVVGLWWAWAQVRRRPERGRLGTTRLATSDRGRTTLEPAAVARALAVDIGRLDGVQQASARLVALRPVPEVVVSVVVDLDRDLAVLRDEVEEPLGRLAQALAAEAVDAEVRISVARSTGPRVR